MPLSQSNEDIHIRWTRPSEGIVEWRLDGGKFDGHVFHCDPEATYRGRAGQPGAERMVSISVWSPIDRVVTQRLRRYYRAQSVCRSKAKA